MLCISSFVSLGIAPSLLRRVNSCLRRSSSSRTELGLLLAISVEVVAYQYRQDNMAFLELSVWR